MAATIKDDAPYKDFALRLQKLRKDAKMTRAELGEKIGVAGRSIINYENGERIPFGDTCVKMAQVFGISTDELLGVENPEVEMAKARAIDEMGRIYGSTAANSAQAYLDGTNALLAGGTLSAEDQLDFIAVMRKVLVDAEIRAKEKFTPNKFRTPEWKMRTEGMRKAADDAMRASDAEQAERSDLSEENA
ncbi:MAG: helix-turn-helix transcriptional regulator [Oscillospiraceae bacterium]|nr:helix-turn-helix transcriptional regulator [Oscillospiraceae bacterium]